MNKVIIAGCGYLGQRLAKRHQQAGDCVRAWVRTAESQQKLSLLGIEALQWDLDESKPAAQQRLEDHLLYWLIPPPAKGESDSRSAAFLQQLGRQRPRKAVLISTTGVYGDCGGAWVDEQHPLQPKAARARRRWSAEHQWQMWAVERQLPLVILRLPGIYGPGRLPLERLRKGQPMLCAEEAPWSNRIHIDDLVQVCWAAMARGGAGEIYNVSDGHPSTMLDYFNQVADLAGLPYPPQIQRGEAEQQLSAEMMSYLSESRRIDNGKMLRDLQVQLRYPTLADGLSACLPKAKRS